MELPLPEAGFTIIQEAEVDMVQFPVADTVKNWLPASPSTVWTLMLTVGGTSGSSWVPVFLEQDTAISDSARSAATVAKNIDMRR